MQYSNWVHSSVMWMNGLHFPVEEFFFFLSLLVSSRNSFFFLLKMSSSYISQWIFLSHQCNETQWMNKRVDCISDGIAFLVHTYNVFFSFSSNKWHQTHNIPTVHLKKMTIKCTSIQTNIKIHFYLRYSSQLIS